jgi:hypothetical protein
MKTLALKKYAYLSASTLGDGKEKALKADFRSNTLQEGKVFFLESETATSTETKFKNCIFFLSSFGKDARAFCQKDESQFENCIFLHCNFLPIYSDNVFKKCNFVQFKDRASFPEKRTQSDCTTKVV